MKKNTEKKSPEFNSSDYELMATPSGYMRVLLKQDIYDWQMEAMDWLAKDGCKVALRTCNESGKTSKVVAGSVIWHMEVFPGSLTISTAGVARQVFDQLMPNLRYLLANRPDWIVTKNTVEAPNGSKYIGFSTDDAGKFEGWHTPDKPMDIRVSEDLQKDWGLPDGWTVNQKTSLFIIVDEAKSVDQGIFDAIERCHPNRLLIASSPGEPKGPFYNCFHKHKHRYQCKVVSYTDCPHLLAEPKISELRDQIQTFGLHDPLVQSMIFGEFSSGGEAMVFNMMDVDKAMSGLLPRVGHERRAAVDVSGGGDEQVLYVREGNEVIYSVFYREPDATELVTKLIGEFRKYELQADWITVDNGGMGEVIIDLLYRFGWDVVRLDFGGKPIDSDKYLNIRTEMYFKLAHRMQRREVSVPHDDTLKEQLSWQKYKMDDKQKLRLIPKAQMPGSPDRSDTLAMLFYDAPTREEYWERRKAVIEHEKDFTKENELFGGMLMEE